MAPRTNGNGPANGATPRKAANGAANGHSNGKANGAHKPAEEEPFRIVKPVADVWNPMYYVRGFYRLFFSKRFLFHRVAGLLYLVQYFAAIYFYFADYEGKFKDSWLLVTIPITAIIQSVSAMLTFTFLPRKIDGGYVNDVGSMSYQFVCENLFFVLILAWAYIYNQEKYYPFIKEHLWAVEYAFVFLPYFWRVLFPQTRLRDTLPNLKENRATYNFYLWANFIVRTFYLFGKHIIGFHLNYLRFANALSPTDIRYIYLTLISGSFSTTPSIFLHTLRFKGYLPGWLAFCIYTVSFGTGGVAFLVMARSWFGDHPWVLLIALGGMLANRIPRSNRYFDMYQLVVMAAFHWGLVNANGSWGDVGRAVTGLWSWIVEEGAKGNWAGMSELVVDQSKALVAMMVANPMGVAGKVW